MADELEISTEKTAPQIDEGNSDAATVLDAADGAIVTQDVTEGNGEDAVDVTSLESAGAHANTTDNESSSTSGKPDVLEVDGGDIGFDAVENMPAGFDPLVHAVNEDGSPKRRADGEFAKKRGRKPSGVSRETPDAAPHVKQVSGTSSATPGTPQSLPVNHKQVADQYAQIFFAVGYGLFGEDWLPDSQDEKKIVEVSIFQYVKTTDMEPVSPGLALLMTLGAYSMKRAQKPSVREKIGGYFVKLKMGVAWLKGRLGR